MNEPPKTKPRRFIECLKPSGKIKKGSLLGDYGDEGYWLLGVVQESLIPVEELTQEQFAQVHRDSIEVSKLHMFGQRRY